MRITRLRSSFLLQRGEVVAEPDRLHLRQPVATAGPAGLVPDRRPAAAGGVGWLTGEACPLVLAAAGRDSSDGAVVRRDGGTHRGAGVTSAVPLRRWQLRNLAKKGRGAKLSQKSAPTEAVPGFRLPEGGANGPLPGCCSCSSSTGMGKAPERRRWGAYPLMVANAKAKSRVMPERN